jgi:hypothetical protein
MKGIDSLIERLSNLLLYNLKRELPIMKVEFDKVARATQSELDLMGKSRDRVISEFF